jgi:hypothetical protein
MKAGVYMGPAGQLVEYKSGCLVYGSYPDATPWIIADIPLKVYLCGHQKFLLDGWEYLGVL